MFFSEIDRIFISLKLNIFDFETVSS